MIPEILTDEGARELLHQSILLGALITSRMLPMVQIIPYLGGQVVPQTVKMGLAVALVILVYPAVWMQPGALSLPDSTFAIAMLVMKEIFVGLTLGFVCALAFDAVRMAGQIIDNSAGLTQATTMVPQLPERVSPTSNFIFQLTIVVFFALGGHRVFLWALTQSFVVLPPQGAIDLGEGLTEVALVVLRLTADTIALGVLLSFPVLAAILLVNLFLALVNKSAPQINVFFLGMPLKAVLASAIVLLSIDAILARFLDQAVDDIQIFMSLMELLAGGAP